MNVLSADLNWSLHQHNLCFVFSFAANNPPVDDERWRSCDWIPAVRIQLRCHQCPPEGELDDQFKKKEGITLLVSKLAA